MNLRKDREPAAGLRKELEPNILPSQLRALERVARRLVEERPEPSPAFRARLNYLMRDQVPMAGDREPTHWRLWAAVWLASGLVLLGVLALLVAAGQPGGH